MAGGADSSKRYDTREPFCTSAVAARSPRGSITLGAKFKKDAPRSGSLAISCVTVNALSPKVSVSPSFAFRLDRIAASGKKIAVYETDMLTGGLGSLILDYYNRKNMNVNLRRFGLGDQYIHQGSIGQLRRENGIDLNSVLEASLED